MDLVLTQRGNLLSGTATYNDRDSSFVTFSVKGNLQGKRFTLYDIFVIEENSGFSWHWCKKMYSGILKSVNNEWVLEGSWKNDQRNMFSKKQPVNNSNLACAPGKFQVALHNEQKLVNKNMHIAPVISNLTGNARIVLKDSVFKNRPAIGKNRVEVFTDSIELNFYDNGDIDGDTISVYYNKQLIVDKQPLKTTPLKIWVKVDHVSENEILMFAENEGSIPPNTAILIFNTSKGRIQIPVDADLKSNGAVYLFRD